MLGLFAFVWNPLSLLIVLEGQHLKDDRHRICFQRECNIGSSIPTAISICNLPITDVQHYWVLKSPVKYTPKKKKKNKKISQNLRKLNPVQNTRKLWKFQ